MDKTKIVRTERKSIPINIKITPALSKWLKENKYSPTAILNEAAKDLGFTQE